MPELNDWNVSYSTISFLEGALTTHPKIENVSRDRDIVFHFKLSGTTYVALLLNEYTLGVEALQRALLEFGSLDFVLAGGNWNSYTSEAVQYGRERSVVVLNIPQFLRIISTKTPKRIQKAACVDRSCPEWHNRLYLRLRIGKR